MSFSTALTTLVGVLGLANLVLVVARKHSVAEPQQRVDDLGGPAPGRALADAELSNLPNLSNLPSVPNPPSGAAATVAPDPRS